MIAPTRPLSAPNNVFNTYSVVMPAKLMKLLQNRLTCLILFRLHGATVDCSLPTCELITLDSLMNLYDEAERHNMPIGGQHLNLLLRFLSAERVMVNRSRTPMIVAVDNHEYWCLLGELIESVNRPTQLLDLSFCPYVRKP